MRKVAIFGNAGGGKSTLARKLSEVTGLPLYSIDKLKFLPGGAPVSDGDYLQGHSELLKEDSWIIDGFGCVPSAWERFAVADTLVHVDLPLVIHAAWVTKRLLKGVVVNPEGWPAGSPMLKSSISSYRVLWPCHRLLTPKYREMTKGYRDSKTVFHLTTPRQLVQFTERCYRWPMD